MTEKRISPTADLGFKKVLANEEHKEILGGLVYDFFGQVPQKIVLKNPYSIRDYAEMLKSGNIGKVMRETRRDITAEMDFGAFPQNFKSSATGTLHREPIITRQIFMCMATIVQRR